MLTKCYYKFDGGVLKTLNLRMCKLTEKVLFYLLVDIFFTRIYKFEHLTFPCSH